MLPRNVGYVDGLVLHHWHGHKADRKYGNRWRIYVDNKFDPGPISAGPSRASTTCRRHAKNSETTSVATSEPTTKTPSMKRPRRAAYTGRRRL